MSQNQSRKYYDTFSSIYERDRHQGYHRWLDTRSTALVAPWAERARVLEVGCGTGLILREVEPIASEAIGLDLSRGMLEVSRKRGLKVVEASATEIPFTSDSFDLVYSFKVLAHVPDLATAVREMVRVTRPGGRLVLEFYNRHSLRYAIRRIRRPGVVGPDTTEDDVYTRFHALDELRALLPPGARLARVAGLRVATLAPQLFRLPLLGPAWERVEDLLSASPLRHFAGFIVLVIQKDPS